MIVGKGLKWFIRLMRSVRITTSELYLNVVMTPLDILSYMKNTFR